MLRFRLAAGLLGACVALVGLGCGGDDTAAVAAGSGGMAGTGAAGGAGGSGGMGGGGGADASISFEAASSQAAEADGTVDVRVILSTSAPLGEAASVGIAATGGSAAAPDDFGLSSEAVSFPAGSADGAEQVVTVTLVGDALVEGEEQAELTLSEPAGASLGADTTHALTIVDSDTASVAFELAEDSSAEVGNSKMVKVILSASGPGGEVTLGQAISVALSDTGAGSATADQDYNAVAATMLSFDQGAVDGASQTFPLEILADMDTELDETVALGLGNVTGPASLGAIDTTLITLLDDDRLITGNGQNANFVHVVDPASLLAAGNEAAVKGSNDIEGVALDLANNILYMSSDACSFCPSDALYRYDIVSKTVSLVGFYRKGNTSVESLAYDPATMTLYGVDDITNSLLKIDTQTGQASNAGPPGGVGPYALEGLAFDSVNNVLYGADDNGNQLVSINPVTGVGTLVGPFGADGTDIESLAYDPATATLYGVNDVGTGTLVTIDFSTGMASPVAALSGGTGDMQALTFNTATNQLIGVDNLPEAVFNIDPATAVATFEAAVSATDPNGMAYDPADNKMFAVTTGDDTLIKIDPATSTFVTLARLSDTAVAIDALAYDAANQTLYGESGGQLYIIDVQSGMLNQIGGIGAGIRGLAFDGATSTLYGVDVNELFTINVATAQRTLVGLTGFTTMQALTFDNTSNKLYAIDETGAMSTLVEIEPATGVGTAVGVTGAREIRSLALDPATGTLLGVDDGRGVITSIDKTTALITTVQGMGVNADGLAYDANNAVLYAADFLEDYLFVVDLANGVSTAVGPFGMKVEGLAYDPANAILYGVSDTDALVTVDPATGAATEIGATGATGLDALAYDSQNSVMYGSSGTMLYTVDVASGVATLVGPHGTYSTIRGLGFDAAHGVLYGSDSVTASIARIDVASGQAVFQRRAQGGAPFGLTFAR